jgi:hypothetical protein
VEFIDEKEKAKSIIRSLKGLSREIEIGYKWYERRRA